jgi:hypothetical protein
MVYKMNATKFLFIGNKSNDNHSAFTFEVSGNSIINKGPVANIYNNYNNNYTFAKVNDNVFLFSYNNSYPYFFYINPADDSITMKTGTSSTEYGQNTAYFGDNYVLTAYSDYAKLTKITADDGSSASFGFKSIDLKKTVDGNVISGGVKTYIPKPTSSNNIIPLVWYNSDADKTIEIITIKRDGENISIADRVVIGSYSELSSYNYISDMIGDLGNDLFSYTNRISSTDDKVEISYFSINSTGKINIKGTKHIVKYLDGSNAYQYYPI